MTDCDESSLYFRFGSLVDSCSTFIEIDEVGKVGELELEVEDDI